MINSKEYWDNRFYTGNWDDFGGKEQTTFFSELALRNMPKWLVNDINDKYMDILDAGCAEGEGTNLFKQFFKKSNITGVDFSDGAIEKAKDNYKQCEFLCMDINEINNSYDVIFSSNVLEHLRNSEDELKKLTYKCKKYLILLLPFQERELCKEHFTCFDYENFNIKIENCYLSYYKVIDSSSIKNTMWLGKQILLVYVNEKYMSAKEISLDKVHNNHFEELENIEHRLNKEIDRLNKENVKIINELSAKELKINEAEIKVNDLQNKINNAKLENDKLQLENNNLKEQLSNKAQQINVYEDILINAKNVAFSLLNAKSSKISHILYRFKYQLLNGNVDEKRNFIHWILNRKNNIKQDHRFQPIFKVINELDKIESIDNEVNFNNINTYEMKKENANLDFMKYWSDSQQIINIKLNDEDRKRVERLQKIIKNRQYKGIIVYPHIVNWEPLQTPQQLIREFAKRGYLCIFSENMNTGNKEIEIEPNIVLSNDEIIVNAIKDEEVIVLCTWIPMIPIINAISNKIVWYHILDKIDIFSGFCNEYRRIHDILIQNADLVTYVAHELKYCIENRNDSIYLPNGCNTQDFLVNIHNKYTPDKMEAIIKQNKKIIGYYGYIASWFNMEMIYKLAVHHEDWIFIIIGESIQDFGEYTHERIILLGRQPYAELADYAKYFDVAIIPFEVSHMMDCVSPIKFFEYCVLGLPVVSSYMKEMDQFKGETVFLANNVDEFEDCIKKGLQPEIKELAKHKGKVIADENTWSNRIDVIEPTLKYSSKNKVNKLLKKKYDKFDVLFLSVIDYDFRYQRPQHLVNSFSKEGHRVFYINANYNNEQTKIIKQVGNIDIFSVKSNRYSAIHISDYTKESRDIIAQLEEIVIENGIRDCVVVVEYPTWVQAARYFKDRYGFRVITDYLDDYTGFDDTNIDCLAPCCYELLGCSDTVIASSNYLADAASKYNKNVEIIRNGTEFVHFNKAYKYTVNKIDKRKVVGYYGAIAHWFDVEKILYIAEKMPDVDIVLIGQVTEGAQVLNKYDNIKLLGEKTYNILPQYLEEFDVCLIPFDTSTDLIKATNPVKFYEYLSAGKKVVATEIPELMPFKDKYVYLANDNETFLNYVKLCLERKDTLADAKECMQFAKENDWEQRGKNFIDHAKKIFPKVSIILLTYNQLDYTKECLNSIIKKTAYPNYEIVIVDNQSSDDTPNYLKEIDNNYEHVKVIINEENYGFAKGNNIGIEACDGEYIVLLNNDTVVTRGWLTGLTKHFVKNNKLGLLGPVTNSISNESKINVSYLEISDMEHFAYEYTSQHMGETYDKIEVLAMFCLAMSREAFDKIGYLEELYGIGMFEDDDYSYKAKSLGYEIKCAEDVFIHHYGNVSFKKLEDKTYMSIFNKNKKIFEDKWGMDWKQHSCRPGVKN